MVYSKKSGGTMKGQAAIERPKASARGMKGQAAMEYLMTYGWAILVIVIVLAVLLFLNPFKAPETCLFQQPGFSCSEALPQVYADQAKDAKTFMAFQLYNKFGQSVTIHKIICTTAAIGDVRPNEMYGIKPTTAAEGNRVGAGSSFKYNIPCVGPTASGPDDDTTQLKLNANSEFKGVVTVVYNFDNDPDQTIQRRASATLVTTVLNKEASP